VYSSYLGGSGFDQGLGIALDALPNPNAYVSGLTASTNFPTTTGAFDTTYNGGSSDAFVTKIADVSVGCTVTSEGEQGECNQVDGRGMNDEQGGNGNFSYERAADEPVAPAAGEEEEEEFAWVTSAESFP